jgi:hypothetical protein
MNAQQKNGRTVAKYSRMKITTMGAVKIAARRVYSHEKQTFRMGKNWQMPIRKRQNGVRAFLVSQAERRNWPFIQTMAKQRCCTNDSRQLLGAHCLVHIK